MTIILQVRVGGALVHLPAASPILAPHVGMRAPIACGSPASRSLDNDITQ